MGSGEWFEAASRPVRPVQVDSSVPNVARVRNFLIGGRDNFEADRRAARRLVAASPIMAQAGRASLAFLRRAVSYLAAEAGIRQFLDIGTGMPAAGNTLEVAQAADPSCRIVYVDSDPVVLSHARALLRSTPQGATSYLQADPGDTEALMAGTGATLDLGRPVCVIMIDILSLLEDAGDVLARIAAAVAAGSYLTVVQPARDERLAPAARRWNQVAATPVFLRDRDQVAGWLAGLEVVAPGLVEVHQWRPDGRDPAVPRRHAAPRRRGEKARTVT